MNIDTSELNRVKAAADDTRGLRIGIARLVKRFGEREVLHGLDLDIDGGQFVAIVGRSGCGKSTLLRLLAGLDDPSGGNIRLDGREERDLIDDVRMMFQDARLLPWRTVIQNVALGLAGPKAEIRERALEVLAQVGLADRADEWPTRLSGGQRQRVALARALIHRPRLLLLDEPLGALDALTRIEMQRLIERIWRQHQFTAVLVTHDVSEAVALADRILLIEDGRITLDEPVRLARPREHGESHFARLEGRVLKRLMTVEAISSRNQIRGTVIDILVDSVLSEVEILTQAGVVAVTVLTRSLAEQPLELGAEVLATFKSNEVVLATATA
ncbi:MAG: ATP-binding cassette domain-containing protein [Dechloromonas sp.]|uniref:ATP-binding cassette domain-containing protein n=1 Tax=Candidatus Dechloromonas phosphorivorans TaxID=2899244 RepID=A0A9D7LTT2_9RHOO|nr:ATP-binding cassette domain-containing protein [Candidatus Dechloromonas phosphorivorans]